MTTILLSVSTESQPTTSALEEASALQSRHLTLLSIFAVAAFLPFRRLAPDEGLRCKCDRLDPARDYRRLHRRLSLVDVRLDAVARIPDRRSQSPRQGPIHSVHVGWWLVGGEAMKSAMMGATLRWGLASVLVTGLLLVSGAGPGAGEQPLMRDLELEALREAVRWPGSHLISVISLT